VTGILTSARPHWEWVVAFLVVLAFQRVGELVHSARNVRELRRRGAVESGAGHFPLLVAVHVLFPLALVGELVVFGGQPGTPWLAALVAWLLAQALRYWAVSSLGPRWSVGIWVVPGASRVHRGPYRFLRHPNYVAVVTELAAAPLMFGAWRTAIAISALNACALVVRIRAENAALRGAEAAGAAAR